MTMVVKALPQSSDLAEAFEHSRITIEKDFPYTTPARVNCMRYNDSVVILEVMCCSRQLFDTNASYTSANTGWISYQPGTTWTSRFECDHSSAADEQIRTDCIFCIVHRYWPILEGFDRLEIRGMFLLPFEELSDCIRTCIRLHFVK